MKLAYRSFAAGEVSRRLGARVDQVKYQTGAYTMRNMVSTLEGAVQNRAGFGYVRPCHDFTATNPPRLLPFVFSDDQSYVIVLEHLKLSVISLAEPQFVAAVNITGATAADPCVVTAVAHGLTTGDLVWITDVAGMTEINNRFFRAVVLTVDTFELEEESGTHVDSSAFTAYVSGGTVQKVYSISAPWDGADLRQIRFAQSADVMLFAHPDYPVYKLERDAGPTWSLSEAVFGPETDSPVNVALGGTAGTDEVSYRVTAVSEETLEESFPSVGQAFNVTTIDETALGATTAITGITNGSPPIVTASGHGLSNGQYVYVTGVSGMTEVNGNHYLIANVSGNTFRLKFLNGDDVDATLFGSYVSGGTVQRAYPIQVTTPTNTLATGDRVEFDGVESPFEYLNSGAYLITVSSATVFTVVGRFGTVTQSDSPAAATVAKTSAISASLVYPSSTNPVTVSWSPVDGALEYNVYRELNGIFAYVGTSATTSFEDRGYEDDPFDTPPIDRAVFAATGDYPAVVGLFQQRLLLGGSENNPERVDAGRTGLLYNFTKSNPIQADDSFSWVMRSNQMQGIRHILEMSRCLIFTQSAVFTLEGDEANTLLPAAINPRKRAEHGVGDVAPIAIGNAVLYVQAFGKVVHEILPGSGDDFNSKDLTVYSRHLFDRNSVIALAYAEEPSSAVWAVRDDGTLLGFTYRREHEVGGWHRHDTGAGDLFVDVCSVPEEEETATYAVVRRFGVGGGDRYYIERMASRQVAHQADGLFLDSYRYHEDENADAGDTYTLDYDDGTGQWTLEATGTTANWLTGEASADIGRVILLYGEDGERIWCTVLSITSADIAVVGVRTDVPGSYDDSGVWRGAIDSDGAPTDLFPETLPYVTADWSQSVDTITDAWHLEGRGVRAVVDGVPQGPFVVTDGSFDLASPGVQVVWGLQVVSDLVTLEPDNPNGETWAGKMKTVSEIDVRLEESDGVLVGTSPATFQPWNATGRLDRPLPAEGQPYTGTYRAICGGTQTMTGRVHIRQRDGLPTTILGVYPALDIKR